MKIITMMKINFSKNIKIKFNSNNIFSINNNNNNNNILINNFKLNINLSLNNFKS